MMRKTMGLVLVWFLCGTAMTAAQDGQGAAKGGEALYKALKDRPKKKSQIQPASEAEGIAMQNCVALTQRACKNAKSRDACVKQSAPKLKSCNDWAELQKNRETEAKMNNVTPEEPTGSESTRE